MRAPRIVVIAGATSAASAEYSEALQAPGLAVVVGSRDDAVWLSRQFNASAVVIDVAASPSSDDPIYELCALSTATALGIVAVRPAFDDSEPCEAHRLSFISRSDGLDHLRQVVDALVNGSAAHDGAQSDIHVDVGCVWTLANERLL